MIQKPQYDFNPEYDANLKFRIWKIDDKNKINSIVDLMKEKNILIADGHHRYETSRIFMHEVKEMRKQNIIKSEKLKINSTGTEIFPEDAVLALFVNFNQENIKILPTYRMIKLKNFTSPDDIKLRLKKYFSIIDYKDVFRKYPEDSYTDAGENDLLNNINNYMNDSKTRGIHSFCFIFADKSVAFAVLAKKLTDIYGNLSKEDEIFENLDVRILHKLIIEDLLSSLKTEQIDYTHSINELMHKINENATYDMGIILNAPSIKDVEYLSFKGKVMPQKSTYFYPKPCSGLLMYRMDLQN